MVSKLTKTIVAAAIEAQAAIDQKLSSCPDIAGTAFDQAGLKDGLQIVREYVDANEAGVALDHLRYMIEERGILISAPTRAALDDACRDLMFREWLVDRPWGLTRRKHLTIGRRISGRRSLLPRERNSRAWRR